MTLVTYDLNAGPEGGALTTANSGANVVNLSGGTAVYAAAAAARGAFGARVTRGTADAVVRFPLAAPNNVLSYAGWHRISPVAGEYHLVQFRYAAGTTCLIKRTDTGDLQFWRATAMGGEQPVLLLGAASLTASAYYRITARLNSTTGAYTIRIYSAAGSMLNEISGTVVMGSTEPFTHIQQGVLTSSVARTVDFDHPQVDDGSTTEIPDTTSNQPPAATIGTGTPATATQNDVVPLRGTATDSDGTATGVWSITAYPSTMTGPPSITNPTSGTAGSFVAVAPGTYNVRWTVTDDDGAVTVANKTITVAEATGDTISAALVLGANGWE